jgi:hypothetical protein
MIIADIFKERKVQFASMLIFYCGIILWLGGIAFFGFGVAPQVFTLSPSRDIAGLLNRAFLHRLNIIEFASVAMLIGGIFLYNFRFKTLLHRIPLFMAIVAATLLCIYAFVISPAMNEILLKVHSVETGFDPTLKAQFDSYHKIYSSLVKINLFLLFLLFILQTFLYVAGEDFKKAIK